MKGKNECSADAEQYTFNERYISWKFEVQCEISNYLEYKRESLSSVQNDGFFSAEDEKEKRKKRVVQYRSNYSKLILSFSNQHPCHSRSLSPSLEFLCFWSSFFQYGKWRESQRILNKLFLYANTSIKKSRKYFFSLIFLLLKYIISYLNITALC